VEISLPFGQRQLKINLDIETRQVVFLEPNRPPHDLVRLALAAPIGSPHLREIVRPGHSVAIVTSDITRPCPTHLMLPPLIEELAKGGVRDEDIQVVLALGSHRPHTEEEQHKILGPTMAQRLNGIDSDPGQTVYVGTTSRGTRIEAFAPVVKADIRIALGNVEPHYFAGYSGGAKALVPGVCSLESIQGNHAMMVNPNATVGVLDGNPVREDIEEGANLIGLDFILNVIVDAEHNITAAASGHPVEAHRWLCQVLDYQRKVAVDRLADIVIVSAGGFPKDINLYQAHKALDNAAAAVRPGGAIIWVAECPDGLGNAVFEEWLVGSSADDIMARIQNRFVLGGHKAAAIARILKRASVILVSTLPPDLVRDCGLSPQADLESALEAAMHIVGPNPILAIMPVGSAVVPTTTSTAILEGERA
jgi:nickel-dependent lactate racemase